MLEDGQPTSLPLLAAAPPSGRTTGMVNGMMQRGRERRNARKLKRRPVGAVVKVRLEKLKLLRVKKGGNFAFVAFVCV